MEICQYAGLLFWAYLPTSRNWDQLLIVGYYWIHLQLRHTSQALSMVDAVQLRTVCCVGCRGGPEYGVYILHLATTEERDQSELVGKFGMEDYS